MKKLALMLELLAVASCTSNVQEIPPLHINAPTACSIPLESDANRPRSAEDHIVRVDNDGVLIPQDLNGMNAIERALVDPLDQKQAQKMVNHLLCQAELLGRTKAGGDGGIVPVKLLLYVHGGLNSFGATDRRIIEDQTPKEIMNDSDWHYPIYMSWPSAPVPTWAEQTFFVREGRKVDSAIGFPTAPFMIASDIFRTLGQYPATAYYQLSNEKDQFASAFNSDWLSHAWKTAQGKVCEDAFTNVELSMTNICDMNELLRSADYRVQANLSTFETTGYERYSGAGLQIAASPLRYTLFSLWHSGISESAWDNMKRRTKNMFEPPYYIDTRRTPGIAGSMFFEELFRRIDARRSENPELRYEITLVGHSMGAIVLNNALSHFQAEWITSGALKNIVYMAAASDIEETLSALKPILSGTTRLQTPVDFYNLTLNRVAEVSERHLFGLVPLGSLLVSIDQHYEKPVHPMKRTMGSEVNVLSTIDIIDEQLRSSDGALVFKAFNRCSGLQPSMHGDFGDLKFWRETTWQLPAEPCPKPIQN